MAETPALGSTLDQPGHVGDHEVGLVGDHHAEVGRERRERVVGDLGPGRGQLRDQRGLARVREAHQRDVGHELELEDASSAPGPARRSRGSGERAGARCERRRCRAPHGRRAAPRRARPERRGRPGPARRHRARRSPPGPAAWCRRPPRPCGGPPRRGGRRPRGGGGGGGTPRASRPRGPRARARHRRGPRHRRRVALAARRAAAGTTSRRCRRAHPHVDLDLVDERHRSRGYVRGCGARWVVSRP